jgi:hypothetical protein
MEVHMIIVIEGPDNSGKSVLASQLAKLLHGVYVKSYLIPVPSTFRLTAYQSLLRQAESFAAFVISDRHPAISEPIYGNILRGGHLLAPMDIEEAERRVGAYVYCRPPTSKIFSTISEREQLQGVPERITEIVKAYDYIFEEIEVDQHTLVCRFDYTVDTPDDLAKELIAYAQAHKL